MRECTKDFSPLDHIAIDVTDISENSKFFEDVLGMRICRTMGPEDDPSSVWFDGGIQLCKVDDPSQENGRFQHLGFQLISVDASGKGKALWCCAYPRQRPSLVHAAEWHQV